MRSGRTPYRLAYSRECSSAWTGMEAYLVSSALRCVGQTYLVQADGHTAYPALDHAPQRRDVILEVDLDAEAGAAFCGQRVDGDPQADGGAERGRRGSLLERGRCRARREARRRRERRRLFLSAEQAHCSVSMYSREQCTIERKSLLAQGIWSDSWVDDNLYIPTVMMTRMDLTIHTPPSAGAARRASQRAVSVEAILWPSISPHAPGR